MTQPYVTQMNVHSSVWQS